VLHCLFVFYLLSAPHRMVGESVLDSPRSGVLTTRDDGVESLRFFISTILSRWVQCLPHLFLSFSSHLIFVFASGMKDKTRKRFKKGGRTSNQTFFLLITGLPSGSVLFWERRNCTTRVNTSGNLFLACLRRMENGAISFFRPRLGNSTRERLLKALCQD